MYFKGNLITKYYVILCYSMLRNQTYILPSESNINVKELRYGQFKIHIEIFSPSVLAWHRLLYHL